MGQKTAKLMDLGCGRKNICVLGLALRISKTSIYYTKKPGLQFYIMGYYSVTCVAPDGRLAKYLPSGVLSLSVLTPVNLSTTNKPLS